MNDAIEVRCPICRGPQTVRIFSNTTHGRIRPHKVTERTWSEPHDNGNVTGVDITWNCEGAGAIVKIAAGLDRRDRKPPTRKAKP